jgi:limonene-1,2-epoxide hydrolase
MTIKHENTIKKMFDAWTRLSPDEIVDFFVDDAVFHNVPLEPAIGKAAILKTIHDLLGGLLKDVTRIKIDILRTCSDERIVFDERIDSFELKGKWVSLPVVGIFEMTGDGKIKAWRDYFDLETFLKQTR